MSNVSVGYSPRSYTGKLFGVQTRIDMCAHRCIESHVNNVERAGPCTCFRAELGKCRCVGTQGQTSRCEGLYTCLYTGLHRCIYTCLYRRTDVHSHLCTHIYTHVDTHVQTHAHAHVYTDAYTDVYTYVHAHVYAHVCPRNYVVMAYTGRIGSRQQLAGGVS